MRPILVVCPFVPFMNRARAPHFGSLAPGCPLSRWTSTPLFRSLPAIGTYVRLPR